MRIQYTYNKYNNSKKATDVSDFLNMILAYFFWLPGAGNIFAIFGFGATICENLANNKGFPWEFQVLFILVYIVDILLVLIHFSINMLTDNIALGEQLQNLEEEKKREILKLKRHNTFGDFLTFAKRAIIYFPSINVGLVFISILIYGITDNNWPSIYASVVVLLFDVMACYLINKHTKWGHIIDGKIKSKKGKIENKKIITTNGLYNKVETSHNINSTQVKAHEDCGEKLIDDMVSNEKKYIETLREYKKLLDDGIITDEEFKMKKQQLLGL